MKKVLFLILLLNFSFNICLAAEKNKLDEANTLYDQEMFLQAAQLYEEILKTECNAPELYYNLGNAYFKANDLAHAILNYERALHLKCDFTDAKYNLDFAKSKTLDDIKETRDFFLKSWIIKIIKLCTSNRWFYISWGALLVFLLFTLFFLFSKKIYIRKITFSIALFSLIIMSLTFVFSKQQKKNLFERNDAIVLQRVISVKSSPGQGSSNLFELHEGTKVEVKTTLDGWSEIKIADQRTGWVESYQIEKI